MRVSRQWTNLKSWKWHGFGHNGKEPDRGQLALYCAACPQPDVNLPADWREEADRSVIFALAVSHMLICCLRKGWWIFMRQITGDGNFSQVHRILPGSGDDAWLADGHSFMTNRERYRAHLNIAIEYKQDPTCNEHHAHNDQQKHIRGLDVTGIGAIACARHGAYCPSSVVDFQKGER